MFDDPSSSYLSISGLKSHEAAEFWLHSAKRRIHGPGREWEFLMVCFFLKVGLREEYVPWASSSFHFKGGGEVVLWNNPNDAVQFSYPPAVHVVLLAQNADEVTPLEGQFIWLVTMAIP